MEEFFPIFVIVIVFSFVTYMVKLGNQHQERKMKIKSGVFETENAAYKQEIEELKERVAVLEKIVTNDKYDLKKEIDKLDAA